jgi:hypothetical protein
MRTVFSRAALGNSRFLLSMLRSPCPARLADCKRGRRSANALDRSGYLVQFFHFVERAIRCPKQGFDGCAILWINRNANAH